MEPDTWNLDTVTADVNLGATTKFVGISANMALITAGSEVKMWVNPNFGAGLGAEAEFMAIGFTLEFNIEEPAFEVGALLGLGIKFRIHLLQG